MFRWEISYCSICWDRTWIWWCLVRYWTNCVDDWIWVVVPVIYRQRPARWKWVRFIRKLRNTAKRLKPKYLHYIPRLINRKTFTNFFFIPNHLGLSSNFQYLHMYKILEFFSMYKYSITFHICLKSLIFILLRAS